MESNNVLVVKVPAKEVADLRECRDYILESLARGVLVIGQGVEYNVEEFPARGEIQLTGGIDLAGGADKPAAAVSPNPNPKDSAPPGAAILREHDAAKLAAEHEREEKKAILRRLKQYREDNGPGCLAVVAAKTRSKGLITDMILRDVLNSTVVLPIEHWRKIGQALDRLGVAAQEASADG